MIVYYLDDVRSKSPFLGSHSVVPGDTHCLCSGFVYTNYTPIIVER